jgi:hypothetical protein
VGERSRLRRQAEQQRQQLLSLAEEIRSWRQRVPVTPGGRGGSGASGGSSRSSLFHGAILGVRLERAAVEAVDTGPRPFPPARRMSPPIPQPAPKRWITSMKQSGPNTKSAQPAHWPPSTVRAAPIPRFRDWTWSLPRSR